MATAPVLNQTTVGKISQVIGAVVDVTFENELPAILTAPTTTARSSSSRLPSTSARIPCAASPWTAPTALRVART